MAEVAVDDAVEDYDRILKKIIILGGTGLLGQHCAVEFSKSGHDVTIVSRSNIDKSDTSDIIHIQKDIFNLSNEQLSEMFIGYDIMIYSVGPDDRIDTKQSSPKFFHKYLVEKTRIIFKAANNAGIKKAILFGSYFAYFSKKSPKSNMYKHHSYIRARVEQQKCLLNLQCDMNVYILQIPYVIGFIPGKRSVFTVIFEPFIDKKCIYWTKGGTMMCTQDDVTNICIAITKYGTCTNNKIYPVGSVYMDWKQMFSISMNAVNPNIKQKFKILPTFIFTLIGYCIRAIERCKGIDKGLNVKYYFKDVQQHAFKYDTNDISNLENELKIKQSTFDDLKPVLIKMMRNDFPK